MDRGCKGGRELAAVIGEVKDRDSGSLGSMGLDLPTSAVPSQGLSATGEGEGTGYGDSRALQRGASLEKPGAGSAPPERRAPAALAAATRGLGPSCSRGLSLLIYYSACLDCLIAEMCSSLY